jgi:hypothetical protein
MDARFSHLLHGRSRVRFNGAERGLTARRECRCPASCGPPPRGQLRPEKADCAAFSDREFPFCWHAIAARGSRRPFSNPARLGVAAGSEGTCRSLHSSGRLATICRTWNQPVLPERLDAEAGSTRASLSARARLSTGSWRSDGMEPMRSAFKRRAAFGRPTQTDHDPSAAGLRLSRPTAMVEDRSCADACGAAFRPYGSDRPG